MKSSSYLYNYGVTQHIIQKYNDKYISISNLNVYSLPLPTATDENSGTIVDNYYDVIAGKMPSELDEIIIEVGKDNTISADFARVLGLSGDEYNFDDVLNCTMKVVLNDDFYKKIGKMFVTNEINEELYNNKNNITLKVVGIARIKKEKYSTIGVVDNNNGFYYTSKLQDYIRENASKSEIVAAQKEEDIDVFYGSPYDLETDQGKYYKHMSLLQLGGLETPGYIYLYPKALKI